jgi:preprotein translocase subunit YajC
MLPLKLYLLMGAPQGASGGGTPGSFLPTLIPFALIIVIFYFFTIRPQSKKQKETQRMLSALKKGDKVVTIGGIHGTIQNVRDSTVVLKVDEGAKIEFARSAIASVVSEGREERIEEKSSDKPAEKSSDE